MAKLIAEGIAEGVETVGSFLRDQRRQAQMSVRQLAAAANVSNPYLSQVERGLRNPSADVLASLAKALRISAETLYVRAGLLDPPDEAARSVKDAVLADPHLSDRHKTVLLDIYASFRRESAGPQTADGPPAAGPDPLEE